MQHNKPSRTLGLALVVAALGLASAQGTSTAPATSSTPAKVQVPAGSAATAAVELNSVLAGRIVDCPASLKVTPDAVCLLATGQANTFRTRIKAKLAGRVVEDWKTSANGQSSSLVFQSGNALSYVLLAQTNATDVLAIVDATAIKTASGTPASAVFVSVADLRDLVTVTTFGATRALSRGNRTLAITANTRAAKVNGANVQLPAAPYVSAEQFYLPASALRSLGCVVSTASKTQLSVDCGGKTATVNAVVKQ
ncbi:stalk domain-containing protein [Deinococcus pimensis]|uniref:stalk domain-containing protein n=1 Tax=Deinococcus pimensis TaxID=309888 RepID=UPI00047F76C4|nr:hypothetical protein [Deinococcus pimensis]